VLAFFDGRLLGVSRDGGIGKRNLREVGLGGDGSLGAGAGAGDGDGRGELIDGNAVDGEVVEVRLEIFEIEGEVEIALINVWNRFNVTTRQVSSGAAW
jgi:hypothetical protein